MGKASRRKKDQRITAEDARKRVAEADQEYLAAFQAEHAALLKKYPRVQEIAQPVPGPNRPGAMVVAGRVLWALTAEPPAEGRVPPPPGGTLEPPSKAS